MYYINTKQYGATETIEAETSYKEAKKTVKEYLLVGVECYISTRATKEFKERGSI